MRKGPKGTNKEKELQLDTEELRAKQSVRTTFKLREQSINLLKISARHLGIKQKTLLDQLLEDVKALELLADDAPNHYRNDNDCRPKTFVLSQKARDLIEDVSSRYDLARDILVELSISRLVSYMDSLSETHDKRRKLLQELDVYKTQLEELVEKAGSVLEKEDPFLIKLERIIKFTQRNVGDIRKTVKSKNEFAY